ncbi:MAG: NTP transferase domain-containing protein, partial [Polyangiales bacterium]
DETYLARIARIAQLAGTTKIVTVVGQPHGRQVGDAARALEIGVVVNPLPARGMASSIALGFAAMSHFDLDAAWLWPVDHPNVELRTLEALAVSLGTHDVAQPRYDSRGGHPPLIARSMWAKLTTCGSLPNGARDVLQAASVVRVAVDDRAVIRDIDTPNDLAEMH